MIQKQIRDEIQAATYFHLLVDESSGIFSGMVYEEFIAMQPSTSGLTAESSSGHYVLKTVENLDLISIDWDALLKLENENPNQSFNDYSITLNKLVDKYMPLRKVTLKEIKQQCKPWIKKEMLSSIRKREKFYKEFIKAKDKVIKEEHHKKYKELRNQIIFRKCQKC